MGEIVLYTEINAPKTRCFNLSTSIDLHKISASKTKEKAISGVTEGLINLNETVTWKAMHFGIWHKMKVRITKFDKPNYFVDEMISGTFKFMKHKHEFKDEGLRTVMIDTFEFSSPLGLVGKIVDKFFLNNYMRNFLLVRNATIKEFAESDKWRQVLVKI